AGGIAVLPSRSDEVGVTGDAFAHMCSMTSPQELGSLPATLRDGTGELATVVLTRDRRRREPQSAQLATASPPEPSATEQPCVQFALCLLSSKWAVEILLALREGPLRFG